jgi:hypothetical protein
LLGENAVIEPSGFVGSAADTEKAALPFPGFFYLNLRP